MQDEIEPVATDVDATLKLVSEGKNRKELDDVRGNLRLLAAGGFFVGIAIDRLGPVVFERWIQYSDVGLFLMIAAVLVLLGEQGVGRLFERMWPR
jgi:hypothetical protein